MIFCSTCCPLGGATVTSKWEQLKHGFPRDSWQHIFIIIISNATAVNLHFIHSSNFVVIEWVLTHISLRYILHYRYSTYRVITYYIIMAYNYSLYITLISWRHDKIPATPIGWGSHRAFSIGPSALEELDLVGFPGLGDTVIGQWEGWPCSDCSPHSRQALAGRGLDRPAPPRLPLSGQKDPQQ